MVVAQPRSTGSPPVCGLSHGPAGIGWALLELFAATGDERFLTAGMGAFEYERHWLDARTGTWPDLRLGGQHRGDAPRITRPRQLVPRCGRDRADTASRVRRSRRGGVPRRSVAGTRNNAPGARRGSAERSSGSVAVPRHGRSRGRAAVRRRDRRSDQHGHAMLEQYPNRRDLPCGAAAGTTPALFRGLSGIGWWYLRLYDHSVPSPLTMPIERLTPARGRA